MWKEEQKIYRTYLPKSYGSFQDGKWLKACAVHHYGKLIYKYRSHKLLKITDSMHLKNIYIYIYITLHVVIYDSYKEQILERELFSIWSSCTDITAVKQVTTASNAITTRISGPVPHKPVKYLTVYFGVIASLTCWVWLSFQNSGFHQQCFP